MDAVHVRRDDDAVGGCIPAGPMRKVVAGEGDTRDLDRDVRIPDIERNDAVDGRDALDEVMAGEGGDTACAAGKAVDQLCFRIFCRNSGDVFKATGVGLDEDGAIRRAPWLFGIGVGSELRAWFEEPGFE